jgi:hypothetical protein
MGTTRSDANIGAKAVVEKLAVLKTVSGADVRKTFAPRRD